MRSVTNPRLVPGGADTFLAIHKERAHYSVSEGKGIQV